jgi:hypothetical protein
LLQLNPFLAAIGFLALLGTSARGQVAFQPVVGSFPNGVSMSVTPVVSLDRRYVRLGVVPQFTALEGFDTYLVPGAVGGGGVGGGGMGAGGIGAGVMGFAGLNGPINGFGLQNQAPLFDGQYSAPDFQTGPVRPAPGQARSARRTPLAEPRGGLVLKPSRRRGKKLASTSHPAASSRSQ